MRRIYMDANATTPLLPEVFEAMRPFWIEHFGNASSIHQQGQQARAAVDHARESIAHLLHCRASEIVFTSGGTESDNLALFGTLVPGDHLITTQIEHHAVLHAAEALAEKNIDVTFLPCTPVGLIEPATLQAAMRPTTRLVSIMFANNETGTLQPIAALAAIAHAGGALFHTDAVQAGGKLPLDLSPKGELKDVDLLSLSGHKMYAPQGTGILFVRRNVRLAPLFHGGTHERQRRAGTENVPGIVALGKAAELAEAWLSTSNTSPADAPEPSPRICHPEQSAAAPNDLHLHLATTQSQDAPSSTASPSRVESTTLNPAPTILPERSTAASDTTSPPAGSTTPTELAHLRDRLEQGILAAVDECGVNGAGAPRAANTTNLYFDHVEAEALVIALDLKGLAVSGGSACQSGATEPSHVLVAMGLSPARARASIRFSLSRLTTAEEIEYALTLIPAAVARLRTLSPTWKTLQTVPA